MRKLILPIVLASLISNSYGNDSHYLIKEMETLRDSLQVDDARRVDLTLRLADLYFDVSIQEGKGEDFEALKKNRLKALELYKHSPNGTDGIKKAEGLTRIKIQFQMARLLTRLSEGAMAEGYYLDILKNPATPKKMIEQSALALAEWYEEEAKYTISKKYYDQAISLCEVKESCNYAYYRKAWLFYKDTQLDEAIVNMEKSLWTENGLIRENSLTDLLLFMSNKETDGMPEYLKIVEISQKANRPELPRLLVEAFYVAGNRYAGSNLLAELNKNDPNLYYEVRLLEEFYGFRKWEKVENYLSIIEKRSPRDIPTKAEEAKEVLTILRRFIVQVDAEMQVVKDLNVFLKRSIDIYLTFYPNDELRKKMQQGWLSAESDESIKVQRLGKWIQEDIQYGFNEEEIRKLRQTRLSMAQKLKLSDIVIEDSLAIAAILKDSKEADEFKYVAARELYGVKKYEQAQPLFLELVSTAKARGNINKWTILSQNLALDIFNHQKNYDGIIAQVALWMGMTEGHESEEVKKETNSMQQVLVQAQFEKAAQMTDSPESLENFYNFCFQNIYPEKSCVNAKVLSVKFKDQAKLVSLLEREKDEKALMIEYELMGRYTDAARLQEKHNLNAKSDIQDILKVALLYELDNNFKERNRILEKIIAKMKKDNGLPKELESAIFLTLDEAGLIDAKSLFLPWSTDLKLKLATRLEIEKPSAQTQKLILSQNESVGPLWAKLTLAGLEKDFEAANSIKFYGARSKTLFKKRTAAIDRFADKAKPILDGADIESRIYILHMLKVTYKNIANEILNTPIPEGLDEETLNMVAQQISTMADPFDRVHEDYDRLLTEQLATITDANLSNRIAGNLQSDVKSYADLIVVPTQEKKEVAEADLNSIKNLREQLLSAPESKEVLGQLKDYYSSLNNARLAAYYSGRIDNLKQVE